MSFAVIDESTSTPRTDAAWLDAHWMPFTGNRNFKANPRMVVGAQGAYYTDAEGRKIFDGLSGLWCSGLGHGRTEVAMPSAAPPPTWTPPRHSSSATPLRSSWRIASRT